MTDIVYTRTERTWLTLIAIFCFSGLNGVFVYTLLWQPATITAALENPVSAVFMVESLLLVGVLAYLFSRWGVSRVHWGWFVFLSLLGGLAFSIPAVLLLRKQR